MKARNVIVLSICMLFIIKSNNSIYAQWFPSGNLADLDLSQFISVVDSNVVWIAGGSTSPVIYKTVNGGANWLTVPVTGLPFVLSGIAAKDASTAYVCDFGGDPANGGNAKVFKTTNSGNSWILVDSTGGTNGYFNGIIFSKTNPQFGVAFSDPPSGPGNPFFILKTSNGGNNWIRENPPGVPENFGLFHTLYVIDPMFYGFLNLNSTSVQTSSYSTTNGGLNWINGNQNLQYEEGGDLVFSDNKLTGIMTNFNSFLDVRRTSNGGVNWNQINTGVNLTGFNGAVWISGTNTVFICSNVNTSGNNNIIRSDNGGLTWVSQSTDNTVGLVEIDYARYNNAIVAYCISSTGNVLKSRQPVQLVGISQTGNSVPGDFKLYQNYPNPFNPNTIIKYRLSMVNFVSLKVFDVLGKEVSTLVNEEQIAGSYEVEFDAGSLSGGIYFYRLSVNDFNETKTMVVLK